MAERRPDAGVYRVVPERSILDVMGEVPTPMTRAHRSQPSVPGPLEFRVLGTLEVTLAGASMALGGPKQQAVLAHLIVRRNELVSADALVDELWAESPPDYARNNIQTYVSHLRRVLGRDRIEWRPPGYLLTLDREELDAGRFEALVRQARKARGVDAGAAIGAWEEALALWRGRPFAGLAEHGSLLVEATRLEELRLAALEERFEALLAMGDHAPVITDLEALVTQHPLRESLWGLLMLAHYRDGRQAEALAAFRRARDVLAEELGIDPSPQIARVHDRILRQDETLMLRGEPLRGYRLMEKIFDGPRARVFRALQPRFERDVAVKIFHEAIASDAEFVQHFEQRAQAVAALEHPHIAPIYDYWREESHAYLVSRYLRGGSLRAQLDREQPVEQEHAAKVVGQVAYALAFAHRQGVVHGNVTSSNVLLDSEGNAYLADFALSSGSDIDPEFDVRELARLTSQLLRDGMPDNLRELTERAEVGTEVPPAEAFAAAAEAALQPTTAAARPRLGARNPYKGLRAFTEADAGDFFGRAELVGRLITRLRESGTGSRFLAVIGPSGSGKSSVVRAGLVPALRSGALGDPARCYVVELSPGAHPFDELEAALLRIAIRSSARLHDVLAGGSRGLLEAVQLVAPEQAEVMLVVDQFEELFTLCMHERERREFLESVRVAAVDADSSLRVVITLRADFHDRPLSYPRFGDLLAARAEAIPPLAPDELDRAILGPGELVGVTPEPGLVAHMIAEVVHEPGALPLLQYSLTELFDHRDERRLTLQAYREIGGVAGSLSARADHIVEHMDVGGRRAVKQVFLRLVTLGEGTQDTRRRVPRGELDALEIDPGAIGAVLDEFGRHRLLTFDRDPATREPTVEIAHEALLTAWTRLRGWTADAREDLRQEHRLARAVAEWHAADRDTSFLLHGAQLEQAAAWAEHTDLALGQAERAYLAVSTAQRRHEREQDEKRRAHEAHVEHRSRIRLRALVAVFAAAALIAGVLTVVARHQSARAGREARIATARELAAAALANLDVDPERSILLAIQAVRRTRSANGSVLPEAEEALHRAVTASRVVLTVPGLGGRLDWSPTGTFAAEGPDGSGRIDIREASTGKPTVAFPGHTGDVTDVAFSPDGSLLATTGDDGFLRIWKPPSRTPLAEVPEPPVKAGPVPDAFAPAFSPDGSSVGAIWGDGIVQIFNLATKRVVWQKRLASLPGPLQPLDIVTRFDLPEDLAFSPDGQHFAVGFIFHNGAVFDLQTGKRTLTLGGSDGAADKVNRAVSWSPDGRYLATTSIDGTPRVWDGRTGRLLDILRGHVGFAFSLAWSPQSTTSYSDLVTGGTDGVAQVWRIRPDGFEALASLSSQEMSGGIDGLAFSPDGTEVMAGGSAVKVWDLRGAATAEWAYLPSPGPMEFLSDGRIVAPGQDGATLTVWAAQGDRVLRTMTRASFVISSLAVSPNGRSIAAGGYGGGQCSDELVGLWDVGSGTHRYALSGCPVTDVAFSPDSAYAVAANVGGEANVYLVRIGIKVWSRSVESALSGARFSADGRLFAIAGVNRTNTLEPNEVLVLDAKTLTIRDQIPAGRDARLDFDPTAPRIVMIGQQERAEIWDLRIPSHRRLVATLEGRSGRVSDLSFSPDGQLVATAGDDETIRIFDARTGGQRLVIPTSTCGVADIAFSPDGRQLATASTCDGVRIWALDLDDLLNIARRNVTRSLTGEECRQYLHVDTCPNS